MRHSTFKGEVELDYVLRKSTVPSDVLVVSFPGAGGDRFKANSLGLGYLMTIGQFDVNSLYLKNTDRKFSKTAFIGVEGDFAIERTLMELVKFACSETSATRCIGVGSSMGGNSALYYGLKYNWDVIAGGARSHTELWTGRLVRQLIPSAKKNGFNKSLYLCWGKGEPMWVDPLQAPSLVKMLDEAQIPYTKELFNYSAHVSISKMFPSILSTRLGSLLGTEVLDPKADVEPSMLEIATELTAFLGGLGEYTTALSSVTPNCSIQNRFLEKPRDGTRQIVDALAAFREQGDAETGSRVCQILDDFLAQEVSSKRTSTTRKATAWRLDMQIATCLIELACLSHEKGKDFLPASFSLSRLQSEIVDRLLNVLAAEEYLSKMKDSYSRMQFLLLAAVYFKNDAQFSSKVYERVMRATNKMTDVFFDTNGVCTNEQVQGQHRVLARISHIVKFVESNGFESEAEFKKLKRRLAAIETVATHLTRPDGSTPSLGHSSQFKSRLQPSGKTFAKIQSNLAVLAQDRTYITIGGGSNVHSAYRHCDLLSFTFWYDGQQLVYDAGGGEGELSDYARSAVAHSALLCDRQDYVTPSYGDWTTLVHSHETNQHVVVVGKHRLIDGVVLTRTWIWLKPNVLVLLDECASAEPHLYTQNFLLPYFKMRHIMRTPRFRLSNLLKIPYPQMHRSKTGIKRGVARLSIENVMLSIKQFDAKFELEQNLGIDQPTADPLAMRGSLIAGLEKLQVGLNLAYNKRAENAQFLTVLEARSGLPGELVVDRAQMDGERLVVTLAGGKTLVVPLRPRSKEDEEDEQE